MEKTVTLRFYDVRRRAEDRPALADLLVAISRRQLADRERRIGEEEILVRLEDFSRREGHIFGQFIRGQSGNRPGRMLPQGTDALPFDEPLGHGIAFRYREADGVLAIEFNPFILSPSRIFSYLYEFDGRAEYEFAPRMRDDAWERFEEMPVRKLTLSIAGHPHAGRANDPNSAVWANISDMRDRYGAETVRIELSRGHRGGALTEASKRLARDLFTRHQNGTDDIRAIKGVIDTGEGIPNEELDLLGELFDVKEELHFPENNWTQFYTLRRNLLRDRLNLLQ